MRGAYIPLPPQDLPPQARAWAQAVTDVLRALPVSVISTANGPNVAGELGDPGWLAIDVASSATTRLWQKRSASTSTTGWSALSWI